MDQVTHCTDKVAEAPGLVPVLCLVVAAWYYVWERIDSIHLVKREVSGNTSLATR